MTDDERAALAARLAKAQAELREREARAEAREADRREREEVEAAELELRVRDALERLASDGLELDVNLARVNCSYPNGHVFGVVLLKGPHPLKWRAFENQLPEAKGTKKDELRLKLLSECLAWPDMATVEGHMQKQPFNLQRFTDAIAELAGAKVEEVKGKS